MIFDKKFKITTLEEAPDRLDETVALIENGFNYPEGQNFVVDFAPLINESNFQNNHIIIDFTKNIIVGHIGVVLRRLGNKNIQMRVALIGGVVTHKDYQQMGLFSHLMKYVMKEYHEDSGLFLLWSDLPELYKKYSFFPAGGQVQLGTRDLDNELEKHFEKTKLFLLSDKERIQIKEIYNKETAHSYTTLVRTEIDWSAISRITSADLYIKRDDEGIISSYFFANKGHDLANIIHEVGFKSNFKNWTMDLLQEYKLWLPEQEKLFFNTNKTIYMAMIKIGEVAEFNRFLAKWSRGELKIKTIANARVIFRYRSEEYEEPLNLFLTFIFGPTPLKEFEKYGPPLYLSGLDSI
ncbi:MAG: GNAT family N-acetyltransferase [Bacteriovoracaceae bacterium]|nr:GNAT family N-acetyltransferase [Bacteriovoracaceae bacterium]